MNNPIARFLRDEEGASALEYGLVAGLMAVAVIAVIATFTDMLSGLFSRLGDKLAGR